MASEKIAAIVEEVKGLTVLELSELVHTLAVSYTHLRAHETD